MRSKLSTVLFAVVFALIAPAIALEAQEGLAVDIDVDCDDAELRSLVRGFLSRELRELGDVRVGEAAAPDYLVEAIAEKAGQRGWYMSVVISAPFDAEGAGMDADAATQLDGYTKSIQHDLSRGDSAEDLGRVIGLIARDFNTEVLKPMRKERKKKK